MISVLFDPGTLVGKQREWWDDWQDRATAATSDVIQDWEDWVVQGAAGEFSPKWQSGIWSELKKWLLDNVFNNKCAYCEITLASEYGDAEHVRPKGNVIVRQAGQKQFRPKVFLPPQCAGGAEIPHPGYFWLAYDLSNLVPSCEKCNTGAGKVDQHPVAGTHTLMVALDPAAAAEIAGRCIPSKRWPGLYYLRAGALDDLEKPLLINCLNPPPGRRPEAHLTFGKKGTVAARGESPEGQRTIGILHLDRDELNTERSETQDWVRRRYFSRLAEIEDPDEARIEASKVLTDYRAGRKKFSAAVMDYMTRYGT